MKLIYSKEEMHLDQIHIHVKKDGASWYKLVPICFSFFLLLLSSSSSCGGNILTVLCLAEISLGSLARFNPNHFDYSCSGIIGSGD